VPFVWHGTDKSGVSRLTHAAAVDGLGAKNPPPTCACDSLLSKSSQSRKANNIIEFAQRYERYSQAAMCSHYYGMKPADREVLTRCAGLLSTRHQNMT